MLVDFTLSPLGHGHYAFVVNLFNVPSTCAMPSQGPQLFQLPLGSQESNEND
jgi:hypothetical protein